MVNRTTIQVSKKNREILANLRDDKQLGSLNDIIEILLEREKARQKVREEDDIDISLPEEDDVDYQN